LQESSFLIGKDSWRKVDLQFTALMVNTVKQANLGPNIICGLQGMPLVTPGEVIPITAAQGSQFRSNRVVLFGHGRYAD